MANITKCSIDELASGVFRARKLYKGQTITYTGEKGETKEEVRKKFNRKFEDVIRMGTVSENWKVSEYVTYWLDNYKKPLDYRKELPRNKGKGGRVSGSSYTRMLQVLNSQLKGTKAGKLLLRKQLQAVKPEDIQNLINELERSGLSDSTVKKTQNLLSAAFREAMKNGYMLSNPALLVSRNGIVNERRHGDAKAILNEQDIKDFLKEALKVDEDGKLVYPYGAGAALQLATGCRSGEIRALDWDNVRPEEIRIEHSVSWIQNLDENDESGKKRVTYLSNTKSKASRRSIPYSGNDLIDKCLKLLKQRCMKIPNKNNLVLPTSRGGYLTPNNYNKEIDKILQNCHIPHLASHALRHSFISLLVNDENCDLATVANLAGHGDIRVTLHYANHTDNQKKKETLSAISKLGE